MKQTIILLLILSQSFSNNTKPYDFLGANRELTVHIISIGINDLSISSLTKFINCENDAKNILKKIIADKSNAIKKLSTTRGLSFELDTIKSTEENKININKHQLLGENATLENIKKAFTNVIKESTTNDYFFFFYAGTSITNDVDEEILLTYNKKGQSSKKMDDYDHLSVKELASLINQVAAKNQIFISESGIGKSFSEQLQMNLFELNPDIAINTERNRIILTTINYGFDNSKCNKFHGPLTNMILQSGNIFEVFHNYHYYEYLLNKEEVTCSPNDRKYYFMTREEDFKNLFRNRQNALQNTRGSVGKDLNKKEELLNQLPKTHALIIATTNYSPKQNDWKNLKNPINDANAVGQLLELKFGANITKLYNEPKQTVIRKIIEIKNTVNPNDQLLVFIAGHGYYSKNFSQGYIVTTDSSGLADDIGLDTYIPLSTLNNLLDGFSCKPIFTILDICYGSSFEINNANIVVENYSTTKFDRGLDHFILETNKNYARIMLASGEGEVFDFWNASQNHSPFAEKILTALKQEKEFISPGKLYAYVRGNATLPVLKKFGKHETNGDFLLEVKL
ncbi:MAG: caspase family protein [Flavobacterium sp.]